MKEYKILEVKKNEAEKVMNDMAKEGWEVVSVNYWNAWKISLMIISLKRNNSIHNKKQVGKRTN